MASEPGQFDPQILSVFSGMIGIFPVGAMVRLQSDRLAVVLDDPDGDPLTPPVCPFYCIMSKQALPWRLSPPGMDPIVGIESPDRWRLTNWNEMRTAKIITRYDVRILVPAALYISNWISLAPKQRQGRDDSDALRIDEGISSAAVQSVSSCICF